MSLGSLWESLKCLCGVFGSLWGVYEVSLRVFEVSFISKPWGSYSSATVVLL
jgi:hypothetical protein